MLKISQVESEEQIIAARELFREYTIGFLHSPLVTRMRPHFRV